MNWVPENKKIDHVSSEADTEGRCKDPHCRYSLVSPGAGTWHSWDFAPARGSGWPVVAGMVSDCGMWPSVQALAGPLLMTRITGWDPILIPPEELSSLNDRPIRGHTPVQPKLWERGRRRIWECGKWLGRQMALVKLPFTKRNLFLIVIGLIFCQ